MSVRTILVAIIVELGTTMNNFLLSKNVLSFLYIYIYVSITWLKKKKTEEIPKVSKTNMIAIE